MEEFLNWRCSPTSYKVEKHDLVNDHCRCNGLGVTKWLLRGPKLANCKSGPPKKDAMIGQIGHVSSHYWLLLSVTKLFVLCAFVCKVGYFDAWIRETIVPLGDFTYLPLWEQVTNYLYGTKVRNNLHFSSSPPLHLRIIMHKFQATILGHIHLFSPFQRFYLKHRVCMMFGSFDPQQNTYHSNTFKFQLTKEMRLHPISL